MHIGSKGEALVKAFEGCLKPTGDGTLKPYICPAGVLTIGWGHTNDHGRQFDRSARWTQAECDTAFDEDMTGFDAAVQRRVRVPLEQNQFDALVSFTYNCGEGNLAKSTLLRKLNRGDYDGAATEFSKWNRGGGRVLPGLTRRRKAEAALFRGDHPTSNKLVEEHDSGAHPMPQQIDPPVTPAHETGIGVTQIGVGAAAAGGISEKLNDVITQAGTLRQGAEDFGLFDIVKELAHQPTFLIFVAIAIGAVVTWYLHSEHLKGTA